MNPGLESKGPPPGWTVTSYSTPYVFPSIWGCGAWMMWTEVGQREDPLALFAPAPGANSPSQRQRGE